jgi:hypothetical protein
MIGFKMMFANLTRGEGLLQRSFSRWVMASCRRYLLPARLATRLPGLGLKQGYLEAAGQLLVSLRGSPSSVVTAWLEVVVGQQCRLPAKCHTHLLKKVGPQWDRWEEHIDYVIT